MLAKEPDSSSVKSAEDRESLRDNNVMQKERLSKKTKRTSGRPEAKPKKIRDAGEEKLAELGIPVVEAIAERTELSAKPGDSKGERQGSQEGREGR